MAVKGVGSRYLRTRVGVEGRVVRGLGFLVSGGIRIFFWLPNVIENEHYTSKSCMS